MGMAEKTIETFELRSVRCTSSTIIGTADKKKRGEVRTSPRKKVIEQIDSI